MAILTEEEKQLVYTLPLFNGVKSLTMQEILQSDDSFCMKHAKNKRISTTSCDEETKKESMLGIILSGTANVYKGNVMISTLKAGNIFGAAMLFHSESQNEMPTEIRAKETCKVVYIKESMLLKQFMKDEALLCNYLRYQNGRIRFLVGRIAVFSASLATEKLYRFLTTNVEHSAEGEAYYIPKNMSALANSVGIGRATLYRVLDELESGGLIIRDGDRIVMREPCN